MNTWIEKSLPPEREDDDFICENGFDCRCCDNWDAEDISDDNLNMHLQDALDNPKATA